MVRVWSVTAQGHGAVQVKGRNWLVALGRGLDELGRADALMRLACEVLPNGTVIARDITTGTGYVVQALQTAEDATALGLVDDHTVEAPMPLPEAPDPTMIVAEEDADGEPIFELPADAISEIEPEDDPGIGILDAETAVAACQLALVRARERVGAESGAVIVLERGVMRFVAVHGPHARKLLGTRLPMGTGVAGFSMEKRRSVVLADAQTDPRHCGEVDALTGYVTREIAVVPLVHGERALGVLEVMNLPDGRRFGEDDLAAIRQLADALAIRLAARAGSSAEEAPVRT
ncbi:MAG: GAF domain-containing protein [Myxococcota bacterium]